MSTPDLLKPHLQPREEKLLKFLQDSGPDSTTSALALSKVGSKNRGKTGSIKAVEVIISRIREKTDTNIVFVEGQTVENGGYTIK